MLVQGGDLKNQTKPNLNARPSNAAARSVPIDSVTVTRYCQLMVCASLGPAPDSLQRFEQNLNFHAAKK